MSRSARALCAATIVLLSASVAPGKSTDKARYSPPQNGKGGRIDIEQYYRIDDPQEAARTLLEEARLAQVDIDQRWEGPVRNEVRLGSGTIVPDKNDRRFFEKADRLVKSSDDEQQTICVIKCSRVLTIRETAQLMEQGIRIYRGAPFYALFASVPASAGDYLKKVEAIDWVGELTPQMKYDTSAKFSSDRAVQIQTLVGDKNYCREDLTRLGGEIVYFTETGHMHHRYEMYTIRIAPDRIPDLASLWWVHDIYQPGPYTEWSLDVPDTALTSPPLPPSGFFPLDSRRLVSWDPNMRYTGYSQELLLYENGCYWEHGDLIYQVLRGAPGSGLSDPRGVPPLLWTHS